MSTNFLCWGSKVDGVATESSVSGLYQIHVIIIDPSADKSPYTAFYDGDYVSNHLSPPSGFQVNTVHYHVNARFGANSASRTKIQLGIMYLMGLMVRMSFIVFTREVPNLGRGICLIHHENCARGRRLWWKSNLGSGLYAQIPPNHFIWFFSSFNCSSRLVFHSLTPSVVTWNTKIQQSLVVNGPVIRDLFRYGYNYIRTRYLRSKTYNVEKEHRSFRSLPSRPQIKNLTRRESSPAGNSEPAKPEPPNNCSSERKTATESTGRTPSRSMERSANSRGTKDRNRLSLAVRIRSVLE